MNQCQKISEDEIREIIAKHYNTTKDWVTLYHDYEYIMKNDDKVKHEFVYGIVDCINSFEK